MDTACTCACVLVENMLRGAFLDEMCLGKIADDTPVCSFSSSLLFIFTTSRHVDTLHAQRYTPPHTCLCVPGRIKHGHTSTCARIQTVDARELDHDDLLGATCAATCLHLPGQGSRTSVVEPGLMPVATVSAPQDGQFERLVRQFALKFDRLRAKRRGSRC